MDKKLLVRSSFFQSARCRLWPAHGCRCLSPSIRDKRRTWASLPRSPSPRHLYSITTPWGPGAPSACVLYVWRGRVPLTSEVRLIRTSAFIISALSVAPTPPATTRRSMYAALPRWGPRGPICGVSFRDRLRLR